MKRQLIVLLCISVLGIILFFYFEHKRVQEIEEQSRKSKEKIHQNFEEIREKMKQDNEDFHRKFRDTQREKFNSYIREGGPLTSHWKEELEKLNVEEQRYLHGK